MTVHRRSSGTSDAFAVARAHMVRHDLRRRGVQDERVLDAMAAVPREVFVPGASAAEAYADRALPIAGDQTISQPYVVAVMLEALALEEDDRVLEVGSGSGYVLALLDRLVAHAVGVERVPELAAGSRAALDAVGATDVEVHVADGSTGWRAGAPYDAILVSAGGREVPPSLVAQLAPGGRLVVPVGDRSQQRLVLARRTGDGVQVDDLGGVLFVPLIGAEGWPDG